MACGLAVVFAGGVLWLTLASGPAVGIAAVLRIGFTPFIVADVLNFWPRRRVMPSLWKVPGKFDR